MQIRRLSPTHAQSPRRALSSAELNLSTRITAGRIYGGFASGSTGSSFKMASSKQNGPTTASGKTEFRGAKPTSENRGEVV